MKIDGKLIKELRKEAKITRVDLCKSAGISISLAQKLEMGDRSVSFANLVAIAEVIDQRLPGAKKKILNSVSDEKSRTSIALLNSDMLDRKPIVIKKRTVQERLSIANTLIEGVMEELQSVQPEPEIIACGDCKHYICHDRRCGYWNHGVKPLEWCCHGEERNG